MSTQALKAMLNFENAFSERLQNEGGVAAKRLSPNLQEFGSNWALKRTSRESSYVHLFLNPAANPLRVVIP